ncbi:MAG: LemA protein [Planctomycetota bacterium]
MVTRLRTEAAAISGTARQAGLEAKINQQLPSIFILQKAYPELKAGQSFLPLQTQISEVETDIQFGRRYYNGAMRNLNTRIDSFPHNLIDRLFRFQPAEYFELEEVSK